MSLHFIFVVRQPGSANAIVPVVDQIKQRSETFEIFSYPESYATLKNKHITSTVIHSFNDALASLLKIRKKYDHIVLITGTSHYVEDDSLFWKWAKENNIFSYAFVDHWVAYKDRFFKDGKYYFPDCILAIDSLMKQNLIENDIPQDKIQISGHPELDNFSISKLSLEDSTKLKILFVSEPYRIEGWNEIHAIELLLESLEEIDIPFSLKIRPHPREDIATYERIIEKLNSAKAFKISLSTNNKRDDLSEANVIIGISSILVLEGHLIGLPSACILPRKESANDFTNTYSEIKILTNKNETIAFLKNISLAKSRPITEKKSFKFLNIISSKNS